MTVNLIVSKTITGAQAADALVGGGTGVDLGLCASGKYTPLISQAGNTGWQDLFIRHDALIDPITDLKTSIAQFTQSYGGGATASGDFTTMKAKGNADNLLTANNNDGGSSGLRIEMDADIPGALGASAFLPSRAQVKIYGKDYGSGQQGIDLLTGYLMHQDAMVRNSGGTEVDASAPVAGQVGITGNTVLGDRAHFKLRYYLPSGPADGVVIQWDMNCGYSFTG